MRNVGARLPCPSRTCGRRQRRPLALDHHWLGDPCGPDLVLHAWTVAEHGCRHDTRRLEHVRDGHEPSQGVRQRQAQVGSRPRDHGSPRPSPRLMAETVRPGMSAGDYPGRQVDALASFQATFTGPGAAKPPLSPAAGLADTQDEGQAVHEDHGRKALVHVTPKLRVARRSDAPAEERR